MSEPIKPLADRVVAVREEAQTKTASGLYLPDSAKEKSSVAKVVAVGPKVKSLIIGDKIIYKEYSTSLSELKIDGEEFLVIKEDDVLATIGFNQANEDQKAYNSEMAKKRIQEKKQREVK